MHLDVDRIEERIQKLQEVRRIANDPDLLRMLTEFIVMDAYRPEPVSIPEPAPAPKAAASKVAAAKNDEADIVSQLMKDAEVAGGASLWSRARAGNGA
jgi:hypothetical protein